MPLRPVLHVVHWRGGRTLHSVPVAEPPQHRLNRIISKGVLPPAPKSSLNRLDPGWRDFAYRTVRPHLHADPALPHASKM